MSEAEAKPKRSCLSQRCVISTVFLIISTIVAFILLRKDFQRYIGQLPFGWDSEVNATLRNYLYSHPSRGVLLLTGGCRSGKSTAFSTLTSYLRIKQGALVLNADFSNDRTEAAVIRSLNESVRRGLSVLPQITTKQAKSIENIFPHAEQECDFCATQYCGVFRALSADLESLQQGTSGIGRFFDKLEKINEIVNVYVFFNSIDNVQKYSPRIFNAIFSRLARRSTYSDFVPVACEVVDSRLIFQFDRDDTSVEVVQFDAISDPMYDYVKNAHVFTEKELEEVLDNFGPHGGMIERVYEDLKIGFSLHDAIDEAKKALKNSLNDAIKDLNQEKRDYLCGNTTKLTKEDLETYDSLLSRGFMYVNYDLEFNFTHKGVQALICNNM